MTTSAKRQFKYAIPETVAAKTTDGPDTGLGATVVGGIETASSYEEEERHVRDYLSATASKMATTPEDRRAAWNATLAFNRIIERIRAYGPDARTKKTFRANRALAERVVRNRPIPIAALDNFEADLLRILIDCEKDLPHAANGRAVASGDDYADQVLKEMKSGRSKEVRRLLAVLLAFVRRGAKRANVCAFATRLNAICRGFNREESPRPIRFLNRREQREDGMLDMAQLRLEADPDDLTALEGLVSQASHYRLALDELCEEAQDRIVELRARASGSRLALVEN